MPSMKPRPENFAPLIFLVRGEKVLLDADLAALYGVGTKALNQAVKRNRDRFPQDFMFQLTAEEWDRLRSQSVTLNKPVAGKRSQSVTASRRNVGALPYAFTEKRRRLDPLAERPFAGEGTECPVQTKNFQFAKRRISITLL